MFPIDDFRDCLTRVGNVLTECGLKYYITGGAAFIAYGDPRTTQDLDLVVDEAHISEHLSTIMQRFKEAQFLLTEQTVRDAVRRKRQFQLIDSVTAMKVDIYPHDNVPGAITRYRMIEVFPGAEFPIASYPDLIVSKLVRISKGSHRSRRDVRQLMRTVSPEDKSQAFEFAQDLGLTQLFDEVLAEPDEFDLD